MVALLSSSCSLESASDAGLIAVYVAVDKGTLDIDQSVTITVTARNVGYDALTLTGPSDCLMFVEVRDAQGQVVWNSNGGCTGGTVTEEILPGQDKVQPFTWDGSNLAGQRLAGGYYNIRAVARVTGGAYASQSVTIALV
jgi:flagellar hook assembly protein FlgD